MRITCPNCNAHYEIGEDLIRPEGRDVQCSNCGTTWFQKGRDQATAEGTGQPAADSGPGLDLDPDAEAEADGDEGRDDDDGAFATSRPARRSSADKAALEILREERTREDRLRAGIQAGTSDAGPHAGEMPAREDEAGDSGLRRPAAPALDARGMAAAERVRLAAAATQARVRDGSRADPRQAAASSVATAGAEQDTASMTGAGGFDDGAEAIRRDPGASSPAIAAAAERQGRLTGRVLLPDIEEINSSLRPDNGRTTGAAPSPRADASSPPGGFRLGFLTICAVALVLVGFYVFRDPIVRAVPALAEPVARYVEWVDARRTGLEDAVEALTERIAPEP